MIATAWRYLPLLIVFLIWDSLSRFAIVNPQSLPTITSIGAAWWSLASTLEFWNHVAASLWRATAGLALAIVIGIPVGITMATSRVVDRSLGPIVRLFYPMPKSALIPIMVLWLGFGDASKIVLIFIGCILPIVISSYNGARNIDRALIWSARSFGATRFQTLREIILFAALPDIFAGVRTALGLSFLLLVSSELTIARDGLGYLIGMLGDTGVYPVMFAVILTVAVMGFVADRLFLALTDRALIWRS